MPIRYQPKGISGNLGIVEFLLALLNHSPENRCIVSLQQVMFDLKMKHISIYIHKQVEYILLCFRKPIYLFNIHDFAKQYITTSNSK